MKKNFKFAKDSGFSLVEIMMAIGFLSVISLGIMRSMETASKLNKNVQQNMGLTQIKTTLTQLMRDELACTTTIITRGGITTEEQVTGEGTALNAIYNRKNAEVYVVGQTKNVNEGLVLHSIKLGSFDPATSMAQLRLIFRRGRDEKVNKALGGLDIAASVPVVLRRDPAHPTTGPFIDCVADQGSFKALACASMGGWYNEIDQRCNNIYIIHNEDNGGDGHAGYGITSQGGILIEEGALRVGDPTGAVPPPGTIVASKDITSETGNITAINGNIEARREGTGTDTGNITAAEKLTAKTGYITESVGVGVETPAGTGNIQATGSVGLRTAPEAGYALALRGSAKFIRSGQATDTVDLYPSKIASKYAGKLTLRSTDALSMPDVSVDNCTVSEVAVVLGGGRGTKCVNPSTACTNTSTTVRAMVGFNSDGSPNCKDVLKVTDCPAGEIVKSIDYTSGNLKANCCKPTCPPKAEICANQPSPALNDCPGNCTGGTKLPSNNGWVLEVGYSGEQSECKGSCVSPGNNVGMTGTTERCQVGDCGGVNTYCSANARRFSQAACTFTCSPTRKVRTYTSGTSFKVPSTAKVEGDIKVYMVGAGGGGGSDKFDGGHGGGAGEVKISTIPSLAFSHCDFNLGVGGNGWSGGQHSGGSGTETKVRCFNSDGVKIFDMKANGGRGGGKDRNGDNEDGGPGANVEFYKQNGNSVEAHTYSGGRGATGNRDCGNGATPGAGGGGGSDEGGHEESCPGGHGGVIFEYTLLERDVAEE